MSKGLAAGHGKRRIRQYFNILRFPREIFQLASERYYVV
jgi:hypothetical protein